MRTGWRCRIYAAYRQISQDSNHREAIRHRHEAEVSFDNLPAIVTCKGRDCLAQTLRAMQHGVTHNLLRILKRAAQPTGRSQQSRACCAPDARLLVSNVYKACMSSVCCACSNSPYKSICSSATSTTAVLQRQSQLMMLYNSRAELCHGLVQYTPQQSIKTLAVHHWLYITARASPCTCAALLGWVMPHERGVGSWALSGGPSFAL